MAARGSGGPALSAYVAPSCGHIGEAFVAGPGEPCEEVGDALTTSFRSPMRQPLVARWTTMGGTETTRSRPALLAAYRARVGVPHQVTGTGSVTGGARRP